MQQRMAKKSLAHYQQRAIHNHTFLTLQGEWTALHMAYVAEKLKKLNPREMAELTIDASHITRVDLTGAWVIKRFIKSCMALKVMIHLVNISASLQNLFDYLDKKSTTVCQPLTPPLSSFLMEGVLLLGGRLLNFWAATLEFIEFIGHFLITLGYCFCHPRYLRWTALSNHMFRAGVTALPIIGLISFLIGIVLVYQGAFQLKRFGAEIFTVDLLSVSLLREIGSLLTAIVVAGRSGSAFTAQLGTMKVNQELDALIVMGFDIHQMLVVPRVTALVICLPLLVFYADMMGLLGGAVMCHYYIDLSYQQFFHHLSLGLQPWTFWIGLIKAPFFAALIGLIGCFEGLQVGGNAESIGTQTTRSVVKAIFMVIIMDAFFSIFFSLVNV